MTSADVSGGERRVQRLLLAVEIAAGAAVLIAILVVWIISQTGGEFGSR